MTVTVIDLFCGAGGFSTGAALALEELGHYPGEGIELHAINHWDVAIETHAQNHPWAEHYHSGIDDVDPLSIADPGDVELLVGGPECTHHSNARGGKPVSDQKREPAFNVLTWVQKLRPENVLIENVEEFSNWGPIHDGKPSKDGTVFDAWLTALNSLGYAVDHDVLTCADFGDPTSRERLFVIARRDSSPSWPNPSHSDDPEDDLEDWRPASEVIDWSDPGSSMWTRDLENPRVQPLKYKTMRRIAEGLRRHCDDRLEPFADALDWIGRVTQKDVEKHGVDPDDFTNVPELRERVVPAEYAHLVAEAINEPFLVAAPQRPAPEPSPYLTKYYGTNFASGIAEPIDTITAGGNKYGLCDPSAYLLGQHSSNRAREIDRPAPTVATVPRIGLCTTSAHCIGQHSNAVARDVSDRPVPTVAKGGNIHLVEHDAFCLRQQSGGVPADTEDPLPTVSGGGAIGLVEVDDRPLVMPKNHRCRGIHSNGLYPPQDQPVHTLTADPRAKLIEPSLIRYSHGGATLDIDDPMPTIATERAGVYALTSPFLVEYYGESDSTEVDEPLPTATTKDRFALVVPEAWPWGLDIRYRMLKPSELKQAQGFPEGYDLAGSRKEDITEQIGNAVPVNTAKALCKHLLDVDEPSLSTFDGGLSENPDADVPTYEEVASDD